MVTGRNEPSGGLKGTVLLDREHLDDWSPLSKMAGEAPHVREGRVKSLPVTDATSGSANQRRCVIANHTQEVTS